MLYPDTGRTSVARSVVLGLVIRCRGDLVGVVNARAPVWFHAKEEATDRNSQFRRGQPRPAKFKPHTVSNTGSGQKRKIEHVGGAAGAPSKSACR